MKMNINEGLPQICFLQQARFFVIRVKNVLLFLVAYGNIMVDVCRVENTAL